MIVEKNTVLIVDDSAINRRIVAKPLSIKYTILQAENGQAAIDVIKNHSEIGVILLDINMPVMNGFEFLEKRKDYGFENIPVIIMTADGEAATEVKSLKYGAFDFVVKPANPQILNARVSHAMNQNYLVAMEKFEQASTHDKLTGLYNRGKMFSKTRRLLTENPDVRFAMVRYDIDKFRLYNSTMGEAEGDNLLIYISKEIEKMASDFPLSVYGRIDADIFCMCVPFDKVLIEKNILIAGGKLSRYRDDYVIESSMGIYIIEDSSENLESIYTKASMAAETCKNLYNCHFAYYENKMSESVKTELDIVNEMNSALEQEQFVVYLQPKYDLSVEMPCGAEALVRWMHPVKGMIPPNRFIPVFEKNGFVARLDFYMWEHVCALLHKWLSEGRTVYPISVNMSRVSLYNPHVSEIMKALVNKYNIPAKLLQLEVTESAYMTNPEIMKETITKLRALGFTILMDDFGSGYSSLNTLKEINVDVLKLDMKFLSDNSDDGRGEIIISSIVRMAGWLGMPVTAEGVETYEQKAFLESVGCEYVQGYYYAKPMPVEEYEKLVSDKGRPAVISEKAASHDSVKAIWSSNTQIEEILSGIDLPVAIIEYSGDKIEVIRANQSFNLNNDFLKTMSLANDFMDENCYQVKQMFENAWKSNKSESCEISPHIENKSPIWLRIKSRLVASKNKSAIFCCIIEEVTKEKLYENRLERLISMYSDNSRKRKMLVVDDMEMSRFMLRLIFEQDFDIVEAKDGAQALELLSTTASDSTIILLDMIMPEMNGEEFLHQKNAIEHLRDIPVVVISAESDSATQLGMLKNGVNDYIVKPYDRNIVKQRVDNVLAYNSRFLKLVEEYYKISHDK